MMIAAAGLSVGLLMLAGAGCLEPTVTQYDSDQVVLKYPAFAFTTAEVLDKADELCARHGKSARLVLEDFDDTDLPTRIVTYDCVTDAPPAT